MATLNLKALLATRGLTNAGLARHLGCSNALVTLIVKHNKWPVGYGGPAVVRERITEYLIANHVDIPSIALAFNEAPQGLRANAALAMAAQAALSGPQESNQPEDDYMLLRKHRLTREAKAHFRLPRDPFNEEMDSDEDVFLTDDIRYVRAAMRQTAKHGGLLAVTSESGGGKSTLRKDLHHWINNQHEPISVIEPYVIGMTTSERRGQPLLAADITGAVIRQLAPGTPLKNTKDRAAQMHGILRESARIGRKHVLVIEEAHDLATPTLKHMKRFYEVEDGFKKLLAIILVGQTELEHKLSENNPEVREVVQRCELVRLPPLDNHVEGYLRHKLARIEVDLDKIVEASAVDEIRNRLRMSVTETRRGSREARNVSLCHPLAINNLVSAAMNEAVKISAPKINAGLIAAAARS